MYDDKYYFVIYIKFYWLNVSKISLFIIREKSKIKKSKSVVFVYEL